MVERFVQLRILLGDHREGGQCIFPQERHWEVAQTMAAR